MAVAEGLELGSQRLSEDHRRSLEQLYATHYPAVVSRCQRVLGNRDDAADAAQEVFLRAIECAPADRSCAQIRAWLLMVARNHCLDLLRRRKRFEGIVRSGDGLNEQSTDPEGATITRHTVAAVLAGLRLRERQALWQSAVEGHSPAGIARSLGLSYMAAAQLLHRARRNALLAAARVAALFYLLRRASARGHVGAARLVALATLPLFGVSMTSATPTDRPTPTPSVTAWSAPAHAAAVANATHPARPAFSSEAVANVVGPASGVVRSIGGPMVTTAHAVIHKLTTIPSCLLPSSSGRSAVASPQRALNCAANRAADSPLH